MSPDAAFLIERPYQEVVDDILTAIVGGVVNEPIIFDVKTDFYALQNPAQEGRIFVTGTVVEKDDGVETELRRTFQPGIDFEFIPGSQAAIVWQEAGGTLPKDGSTFYVDYLPEGRPSPLSDINVGSVTRTICEAVGREIATVYQQVNLAYLSGFIDTAQGKSLDLVVAILGVTRRTGDFAEGLVTFFRETGTSGAISIPAGTLLITAEGVTFQTTQIRTLQSGQARIDIPIRATDEFAADLGKVPAGAINQLVQPIVGINGVNNVDATVLGAADETDEQLRLRAKAALRGLGKGTIQALILAVRNARANLVEILDPASPNEKQQPLGQVALIMDDEPERIRRAARAVHETRAAGVLAAIVGRFVFFKPRLTVAIEAVGPAAGEMKIKDEIIAAMQLYVDGLSAGEPAIGSELLQAVKSVAGVLDEPGTRFVDVFASRADLQNPGQRIPDRSLVQSLPAGATDADAVAGQQARDPEIEAGQFMVIAEINQEKWSVVLDIEPADITLIEGTS